MIRTQIYLSEEESSAIARLAAVFGKGKSEVIRTAIDEFIERRDAASRLQRLRAAKGIWQDREDAPDVRQMRAEFDRY